MRPTIISISGFSSNVGKTALVCDLLRMFPGWEAIKVSRGHYRSCGKDPQACCVSPLLGERPKILSGREETFASGKDTGRYWEAGASNVHWVICTSEQVEEGVRSALARVNNAGVFIEGTSLVKCVPVDYSLMVASSLRREVKSSAVRVMDRVDALFACGEISAAGFYEHVKQALLKRGISFKDVPIFLEQDLPRLGKEITRIHEARGSQAISMSSPVAPAEF